MKSKKKFAAVALILGICAWLALLGAPQDKILDSLKSIAGGLCHDDMDFGAPALWMISWFDISSNNFPTYARDLNTGSDNAAETEGMVAHNKVHHSRTYPSQIRLSVVGGSKKSIPE